MAEAIGLSPERIEGDVEVDDGETGTPEVELCFGLEREAVKRSKRVREDAELMDSLVGERWAATS